MIRKYYELVCDNCGKVMATTKVIPANVEQYAKVGVYRRGKTGIFCDKECYQDFKLHGKKF